jgi:sulfur carrier protein
MTQALRLNGKLEVVAATTVEGLLRERGIDPAQVRYLAVAVNGSVVPRCEWPSRSLAPEDDVEIVRPLQGG